MSETERFLVTGATGALGAWVVKLLLDEGVAVTAFDDFGDDHRLRLVTTPDRLMNLRRVDGRTTEVDSLSAAIAGASHVVHLDSFSIRGCDQGPSTAATGTANVFAAAVAAGIAGIAFESSMSVYACKDMQIEGHTPTDSSSLFGALHRANEVIAQRYCVEHGLSAIGLRPGLVYGPGQDRGVLSVATMAIAAAVDEGPFHVPYGGRADFQFIGDVAAIFIKAARATPGRLEMINLSGTLNSIAGFVHTVEELTGADHLTTAGPPFPLPTGSIDAALEELLDGVTMTDLDGGIRETLEMFRWSPRDLYRCV